MYIIDTNNIFYQKNFFHSNFFLKAYNLTKILLQEHNLFINFSLNDIFKLIFDL